MKDLLVPLIASVVLGAALIGLSVFLLNQGLSNLALYILAGFVIGFVMSR